MGGGRISILCGGLIDVTWDLGTLVVATVPSLFTESVSAPAKPKLYQAWSLELLAPGGQSIPIVFSACARSYTDVTFE